jgi:Concanavalin A-like lectin/glucanases superfamily
VCSNGSLTDCSTYCVSTVTDSNNCGMCGNTCSSATPTFVDSGLLGYWKLNEGTGTTSADSSGNSHTATLTNSPTWTTAGYSGNALTFDGATNYLNATIGGTFGTNTNISATGWVYATSSTNGPIFGVTNTPPGTGWNMPFLSINGATVYGWVWYGAGGGTAQSATVSLNAWHHLAVTYDPSGAGTQKFYVDGALSGTQAGVYNPSNGTDTFTTEIQGAKPSLVGNFLKGTIDDLRAYNRTLSASEISIIYNARAVCSASACNASCASGETSCSSVCTITTVDPNNCGSCGHVCNTAGGETCQAGVCACPSGQTSCSGTCVDLTTNINHCGTCTTACNAAGGETCITSACGCSTGMDCSGVCTDTTTSSGSCGACGVPCGAITCQSCTQGQLGLWHFDEGMGSTSADSSGSGHTATLTNGPTWVAGYTGDGLTFNGTNNYFSAPLTTWFGNNNNLSAAAWVYATSTTKGAVFGVTNVAGGGSWDMPFLSIDGSTVYGWIWQVNGNTPLSATVSLNNWHFLVVTYDTSAGEKFYVDGALSGSGTGTFSTSPSGTRFVTTFIPGAMPSSIINQHYLNGTIDELSAYNRVLSAGEIKLMYDARQVCVSSMCSGCPTGTVLCGSVCTNTLADKNNCSTSNACGTVCPGAQTCVAGTCM